VLPGIGHADRTTVLHDVGKNHHLRNAGLLKRPSDIHFKRAEARAELLERCSVELLAREAQHAMISESAYDQSEMRSVEWFREIEALSRRPQDLAARLDFDHMCLG